MASFTSYNTLTTVAKQGAVRVQKQWTLWPQSKAVDTGHNQKPWTLWPQSKTVATAFSTVTNTANTGSILREPIQILY